MSDPEKLDSLIEKSKHGGKREGAGRPEGSKGKKTIEKEIARTQLEQRVLGSLDKLINAQISLATGTQMLFVIHTDSKGVKRKPELVTDVHTISRFLDENEGVDGVMDNEYAEDSKAEDYYFITTAPPNNQALQGLIDRVLGKAAQGIEMSGEQKIIIETRKATKK